ncbi:hypothetical protein CsSME_00013520 [Camellia sinensis var. sinensis]
MLVASSSISYINFSTSSPSSSFSSLSPSFSFFRFKPFIPTILCSQSDCLSNDPSLPLLPLLSNPFLHLLHRRRNRNPRSLRG